jgi:hypothetical protein
MASNSAGESRSYEHIGLGGNARGILGDVQGDVHFHSRKLSLFYSWSVLIESHKVLRDEFL